MLGEVLAVGSPWLPAPSPSAARGAYVIPVPPRQYNNRALPFSRPVLLFMHSIIWRQKRWLRYEDSATALPPHPELDNARHHES